MLKKTKRGEIMKELNQGMKKLLNYIKKLMDAGYQDNVISYMISHSTDLDDLNSRFEDELSYIK
ncbi:MAG TPA: hypothetical protein DC000_05095 [Clostridiales bacterium]|nr:hypothetical protein [Clostridiales bacterium]